ncbi:MAG: tRNA (N(6)-L-threonylcarbamoyladenosine(37)-C(2))-methylthiotransferase MtaB [Alkalispirochaeta sp.]
MVPETRVPTVAVETLGCKLNQYESDSIATTLRHRGYEIVSFDEPADAYVINSCTVTNKADRKSRNTVYRARRTGGGGSLVILTGCFVDHRNRDARGDDRRRADRIDTPETGATYSIDNAHKNTIPDLIDAHLRGEVHGPDDFPGDLFGFETPERIFHTRTNIKVQDGCDNFCTFCIIPFVRGRGTSRDPDAVIREASEAIAGGSRELVLTGVNMSRYRSADGTEFVDLVDRILNLPGDFRLRISSLEPDGLDRRFVTLFRHPKMSRNLHLCVQSGSDRVLLGMRRMYTVAGFREIVDRLRETDRSFNITTDIIVGFPGENDDDLAASIRLIRDAGIGHVHTFPFSLRSGTRAERLASRVPGPEIAGRSERIRAASVEEKRRYRSTLIGTVERVLVENVSETVARGLGEHYVPVRFTGPSGGVVENEFYRVRITGIEDGDDPDLIGRLEPAPQV